MQALLNDIRYAIRSFRMAPGFTAVALVALALGMGANTAIFSTINALLLKPFDFADADRLVVFWDNRPSEGRQHNEVTPYNIRALEQSRSYEDIATWEFGGWTLTGGGEPEQVVGLVATSKLFPMLGVRAARGRLFTPDEDAITAAPAAVISHGFWQRRFGGDPSIVGQTMLLDGQTVTVVGVLPEGFFFASPADVWMTLAVA